MRTETTLHTPGQRDIGQYDREARTSVRPVECCALGCVGPSFPKELKEQQDPHFGSGIGQWSTGWDASLGQSFEEVEEAKTSDEMRQSEAKNEEEKGDDGGRESEMNLIDHAELLNNIKSNAKRRTYNFKRSRRMFSRDFPSKTVAKGRVRRAGADEHDAGCSTAQNRFSANAIENTAFLPVVTYVMDLRVKNPGKKSKSMLSPSPRSIKNKHVVIERFEKDVVLNLVPIHVFGYIEKDVVSCLIPNNVARDFEKAYVLSYHKPFTREKAYVLSYHKPFIWELVD